MPEASAQAKALGHMWRKFMRLTRGRIPYLRALQVILDEEKDPHVQALVSTLTREMDNGATLSEAAEKHGELISPSVLELLRYAEKTGAWDDIILEIAEGLEDGTFTA